MGFWKGLMTVMHAVGEIAGDISKASLQAWYDMGKLHGLDGDPCETEKRRKEGCPEQFLDLYQAGYDDGHKERIERMRRNSRS